jgi:hypothetical protein
MNSVEAKAAANWQMRQSNRAETTPAQELASSGASPQSGLVSVRATLAITPGGGCSRQNPITRRELANSSWRNHLRSETIEWERRHGFARLRRGGIL